MKIKNFPLATLQCFGAAFIVWNIQDVLLTNASLPVESHPQLCYEAVLRKSLSVKENLLLMVEDI